MNNIAEITDECSLLEVKTNVKLFLANLFIIQVVFVLLSHLYITATNYVPAGIAANLLSPRELSYFVWDFWLISFLIIGIFLGYSILKRKEELPLYFLASSPAITIMLSLLRDVSFLQIIMLSSLSCAIVIQVNFQRVKQLVLMRD